MQDVAAIIPPGREIGRLHRCDGIRGLRGRLPVTELDASLAIPQAPDPVAGSAMRFRTPDAAHPAILRLCRRIVRVREVQRKGMLAHVPVEPAGEARAQHCFLNVASHVETHGGRVRHGWAIWEWPGVLLQAEFHAVWESPEGRKVDITPRAQPEGRILFLSDPERRYHGRRVDSVMEALYTDELVDDYVKLCERCFRVLGQPKAAVTDETRLLTGTGSLVEGMLQLGALAADPCACGSGRKYLNCHHLTARRLVFGPA